MNKIVGFVRISKDAKTCKGAKNPSEFIGNVCRVVEFGHDDCVMVLNPESTALAMFDKEDVQQSFKCGYVNGVITPPNLDYISEIAYYTKAISRKVSKDFTNEGLFHQWGCSYEEFESGAGNFTVAIVELTDGTIEQVLPSNLKFVDLP